MTGALGARVAAGAAAMMSAILNRSRPRLQDAVPPTAGAATASAAWTKYDAAIRNPSRDLSRFLRWPEIRYTMFAERPAYIRRALASLRANPEWESRWRPAIQESPVGDPIRYWRYPRSSGNLINHAYLVSLFEQATGTRVDTLDAVFEFGGGYGSMCRLLRRLGFAGQYTILDLPALSRIQASYLGALGYRAQLLTDPEAFTREAAATRGQALFVATWSLSETPVPLRERVLPVIERADAVLLTFQRDYEGIDNRAFFEERLRRGMPKAWQLAPLEALAEDVCEDYSLIASPRPGRE